MKRYVHLRWSKLFHFLILFLNIVSLFMPWIKAVQVYIGRPRSTQLTTNNNYEFHYFRRFCDIYIILKVRTRSCIVMILTLLFPWCIGMIIEIFFSESVRKCCRENCIIIFKTSCTGRILSILDPNSCPVHLSLDFQLF